VGNKRAKRVFDAKGAPRERKHPPREHLRNGEDVLGPAMDEYCMVGQAGVALGPSPAACYRQTNTVKEHALGF